MFTVEFLPWSEIWLSEIWPSLGHAPCPSCPGLSAGFHFVYCVPLLHRSVSVPALCCFITVALEYNFDFWDCDATCFAFVTWGFFFPGWDLICSHIIFKMVFSSSVRNAVGILTGMVWNLYHHSGNVAIVILSVLPNQEQGLFFHCLMSSSMMFSVLCNSTAEAFHFLS